MFIKRRLTLRVVRMINNYLCLDIGSTSLKSGLIDANGQLQQSLDAVPIAKNKHDFWHQLTATIDRFQGRFAGMAISVPGQVDPQRGIIHHGGALPYLDQCNLQESLENHYQVPVAVENDGKAAALAEKWRGTLQYCQNGLVLVLGTGVGGGLIINNQLYRGSHFQAGELSLMLAATTGTNFKITGETGSAVKMITAIAHQLQLPDRHDGHQVFAAIADGNPDAERIFEAYGMEVAQIILNVQAVLDVMTVAIGGGISAQPSVVPMIRKQYAALLQQYPVIGTTLSKPEIVPAKFHNQANMIGALAGRLNR